MRSMKRFLALMIALAMLFVLSACNDGVTGTTNSTSSTSPSSAGTPTDPTENDKTDDVEVYRNLPENPDDPYYLKTYKSEKNIPEKESQKPMIATENGHWVHNISNVDDAGFTICAEENMDAKVYNTAQLLGDKFTVGASFCPIATFDDRFDVADQRICTRMMIADEYLSTLFMVTVNSMDAADIENGNSSAAVASLQLDLEIVVNGEWRNIMSSEWYTLEPNSNNLYLEISYDGSSRVTDRVLSLRLYTENGLLFEQETARLAEIKDLAAQAATAGFTVYDACTEFFYVYIESTEPHVESVYFE